MPKPNLQDQILNAIDDGADTVELLAERTGAYESLSVEGANETVSWIVEGLADAGLIEFTSDTTFRLA